MSAPPTPAEARSILLMLASVLLFALNTLLVRGVALSAPQADGWLASLIRGAIGLVVVAAMFGFGRGLRIAGIFDSRLVLLRGIVGAFGILAFYLTVTHLGAARGVILNLTYPVWGTIIAAAWLKERLRRAAILWTLAGIGGLVLFLGGDGRLLHPSPWDLLGLAGAVAAGWVVVIIRRLRHEEHPATVYASQAFYGMLVALPAAGRLPQLPPKALLYLALAGAVVALAQLSMTRAYRDLSVSRGSALQMLLPIVTAVGGFLCFRESFQPLEYLGAGITVLATWRVVRSPQPAAPAGA